MLWFIIALVCILALLFYIFPVIQVCGDSMYPTLKDGDILLGCRLFSLNKGSIYIFHPPVGEKYVIKRLTHVKGSRVVSVNRLYFEGDNPEHSYDSRMYGYVSRNDVVAKYLFTIHKRHS